MTLSLGERVKDSVTGFRGIITGRAEYLHDTPSVRVTAENGQEDLKERWIAEARVVPDATDRTPGFGGAK